MHFYMTKILHNIQVPFTPNKNPHRHFNSGGWVYQGSLILIEGPVKGYGFNTLKVPNTSILAPGSTVSP